MLGPQVESKGMGVKHRPCFLLPTLESLLHSIDTH